MSPHELQTAIETLVNQPGYQPVKPRIIARRLGLPKEEATDVRRAVKRLVRQGKLVYASNHLVRPAPPSSPADLRQSPDRRTWPSPPAPVPQEEYKSLTSDAVGKRKRSQRSPPRVIGVFQRTQKGFGFVRPSPTGHEEGGQRAKETSSVRR